MTARARTTKARNAKRIRVGIVGCGNIAGPYARDIASKPNLELVALTDLEPARAEALANEHGGRAVPTVDDLLAENVDLVVNLTFQAAHAGVTRRSLEAGKHVHSEKPLALSSMEAWDLVDLALQHDPAFPERLKTDLKEVEAWYFYKKQMHEMLVAAQFEFGELRFHDVN